MKKYHITIMSEIPRHEWDENTHQDPHQKYGLEVMASSEEEAIKKGREEFESGGDDLPIEWIEAYAYGD